MLNAKVSICGTAKCWASPCGYAHGLFYFDCAAEIAYPLIALFFVKKRCTKKAFRGWTLLPRNWMQSKHASLLMLRENTRAIRIAIIAPLFSWNEVYGDMVTAISQNAEIAPQESLVLQISSCTWRVTLMRLRITSAPLAKISQKLCNLSATWLYSQIISSLKVEQCNHSDKLLS